jgi:hypothetical protein
MPTLGDASVATRDTRVHVGPDPDTACGDPRLERGRQPNAMSAEQLRQSLEIISSRLAMCFS